MIRFLHTKHQTPSLSFESLPSMTLHISHHTDELLHPLGTNKLDSGGGENSGRDVLFDAVNGLELICGDLSLLREEDESLEDRFGLLVDLPNDVEEDCFLLLFDLTDEEE